MANIAILSFSTGEISPQIDARSDVEKYQSGCRHLENMIPRIYGGVERRPGTYYITSSYNSAQTVRLIPFIYSSEIAYLVEFGNLYMRFFYNGEVITEIDTPYLAADLFQLQCKQLADTMWIVHSSYAPRKLTRTTAATFSLDEIEFRKGPFLISNDLIDPNVTNTATMASSVINTGETGLLVCSSDFFVDAHKGSLFKLIHPRVNTAVSVTGAGTSEGLDIKGTFSFNTHGTWTGTVKIQRNENSSGWENYRTYEGKDDRNIQLSATEDADNVQYRIYAVAGMSSDFSADLNTNESTQSGIVVVTNVNSPQETTIEVLSKLASIDATRRWAEGIWSFYRGYPSSTTFFGDRCIYGGIAITPEQTV